MSNDPVENAICHFADAAKGAITASTRSHQESARLQYEARNLCIARKARASSGTIDTRKMRRPSTWQG